MRPRSWMALGLFLLGASQVVPRRPWRRMSSQGGAEPVARVQAAGVEAVTLRDASLRVALPATDVEAGAITKPKVLPPAPRARPVALTRLEKPKAEGWSFWVRFGYPLAILVAEMTVAQSAEQGVEIYLVLLVTLISHATLTASRDRPLLLALSLVPVARIAELAATTFSPSGYYWYLIAFAPMLLAAAAVAKMNALSRAALSLRVPSVTVQIVIALLGIPLGIIGYLILQPAPGNLHPSVREMLVPALILIACTGFVEEFVFRGVLQGTALAMMGRTGILYATTAFALLGLGTGSLAYAAFMLFAGLLMAWLVVDSGSLLGVSFARGLASVILYLIMPFLSWQVSIDLPGPPQATQISLPAVVPDPALTVPPQGSRSQGSFAPPVEISPQPEPTLSPTSVPVVITETPPPDREAVSATANNEMPSPSQETATPPAPQPEANDVLGKPPEPVPTASPDRTFDTEEYYVQPGDTLFMVAVKHGATLELLRSLNPGQGEEVVPGQRLMVPIGFPRKWGPYLVETGDTITGLAAQRGTTADAVAGVNGMQEGQGLEPGQQILLPPPR